MLKLRAALREYKRMLAEARSETRDREDELDLQKRSSEVLVERPGKRIRAACQRLQLVYTCALSVATGDRDASVAVAGSAAPDREQGCYR